MLQTGGLVARSARIVLERPLQKLALDRYDQKPMLTDDELSRLSPLAQQFRKQFFYSFPTLPHREEFTDCYELIVPAAHPDVGDLRVRDDEEELTLSVGPHHWHVTLSHFDEQPQEPQIPFAAGAANAAIDDLRAILGNVTIFRMRQANGRSEHTMSYGPEYPRRLPLQPGEREYRWTGPL